MRTRLPETTLVELREHGVAARTRFIDPQILGRCTIILRRRGEDWAASVLGRDLHRRARIDHNWPYLYDGEQHTLIVADKTEDKLAFNEITGVLQLHTRPAPDGAIVTEISVGNHIYYIERYDSETRSRRWRLVYPNGEHQRVRTKHEAMRLAYLHTNNRTAWSREVKGNSA